MGAQRDWVQREVSRSLLPMHVCCTIGGMFFPSLKSLHNRKIGLKNYLGGVNTALIFSS